VNDIAKAIEAFEKALSIDPNHQQTQQKLNTLRKE
jgi:Tfp pilus assembly protein PilF